MLNLIVNDIWTARMTRIYYAGIRQNAYGDELLMPGQGSLFFKLDKIADRIPGKPDSISAQKSASDGEYYKTIDLKTDEN